MTDLIVTTELRKAKTWLLLAYYFAQLPHAWNRPDIVHKIDRIVKYRRKND